MRTGKFSFKNAFKRCIYYFVPAFTLTVIFLLICAVIVFLVPAIIYFLYFMISNRGNFMNQTTYLLSIAVVAVFGFVAFVFLTIFLNAVNLIVINNYSLKSALGSTLALLEGKFFKFFVNLLAPYVLIIPIVWLANTFAFYPLVACILFAVQLAFSLSLSMVTYFNISGTQRKDNVEGYYLKGRR